MARRKRAEILVEATSRHAEPPLARSYCQEIIRRRHGVAVWTLDYYRKRRRQRASGAGSCGPLLAVELPAGERGTIEAPRGDGGALAVVLSRGRRIEVPRGFDAGTLEQLIGVLERL